MTEQQPLQQPRDSMIGTICVLVGGFVGLIAVVTVISKWTGWRFKLKGAAIPYDYGSALAFLIVGALFFGIGWTLNSLWFQRATQKTGWTWLGLFAAIGGIIYGIIFVAQLSYYGGFLEWNVREGTAAKVDSSLQGKTIAPARMNRLLYRAMWRANIEMLKVLFKHGAKANALVPPNKYQKERGYRIFHRATSAGKLPVIKLFLEKGADINAKTEKGKTPLSVLVSSGWYSKDSKVAVTKFLLSKGAKLGTLNKYTRRNLPRRSPALYKLLRPQLEPNAPARFPIRNNAAPGAIEPGTRAPGVKEPNAKPIEDAVADEEVQ